MTFGFKEILSLESDISLPSLFVFSPSHPLCLSLWEVIALSSYEIFTLVLLVIQWLVMSFIPIIFDTNQSHLDRNSKLYRRLLFRLCIKNSINVEAELFYLTKSRSKDLSLIEISSDSP
ncbi:hypothetical protein BDF20DRAFT_831826 [Mycotypha africana]|uniref:uncharacterized protein n=1 Tax=Mycotypha africana TaxID=64632 RepID=UPI0023003735|nr:uncharacterized protein BDF20DRAFT_831826 [Mycotypha africana]KAI8991821.1 hypothetical protein BDF20DRAFT_831826 [Mycotypha africana]